MKKILFVISLSLFSFSAWSMGGPGGGGGGDCFQFDTQGEIINCSNCTATDPIAAGDIEGDPSLIVQADGCGPVTLTVEYTFDWNQGGDFNWIHGISFNAGPLWTNFEEGTPAGWEYMPNGTTGCCSNTSYGPGFYYDDQSASSSPNGPFTWTSEFNCTMGVFCTATWNYNFNGCNDWCDPLWEQNVPASTGTDCCNGLDFATYNTAYNEAAPTNGYASTAGLAPSAGDGNPGNNWGFSCGVNPNGTVPTPCPTFTFELTYCPTNSNPTDFIESISFTTSADGESGCWCTDASCDYANGFAITIQNACGPDAIFDDPPNDYCNAADISLNNVSAGYDLGAEWGGDGVVNSPGDIPVMFSYCDNIGNTTLTHTVGENGCYDGPLSESFEVWTPAISNESADVTEGCGTVTPTLTADVDIAGTNTTWGGAGTLVWQEGATIVTDFTVTAGNCSSNQRTFTPVFQTGCAACDVIGDPITITAFPSYTLELVNNPANCGTATANLIGTDGVTVCETVTADCPNPGDVNSTTYNWSGGTGACAYNFSGSVDCTCAGCDAEAGSITIPKN